MNSYFYDITAQGGASDFLAAIKPKLVPKYFDDITESSNTLTFTKDSETVATLALNADGATGYSLTAYVNGETTTKTRDLQSTDKFFSGHETDEAFLFTIINSGGFKYVTIFTTNQNGYTVIISADGDDYFAFSPSDDEAPVTITTVSANDKYVTELVPFTTNTATNGISYTPHAFWLLITSSYPTTGSVAYTFVRMVDQNDVEYFYNGCLAIN